MNNKILYFFTFLCYFNFIQTFHNSSVTSRPIFSFEPLTTMQIQPTLLQTYIPYVQQAALPISACFLYTIHKNNIIHDITHNPYTTAFLIYCALQYSLHAIQEHKQIIKSMEIKKALQEVFYLLVIGHGIRNLATQIPYESYKTSHAITINLESLDTFLDTSHELWTSLFLEYKTTKHTSQIMIYHSDSIQLFEILQAASHDPKLMNMVINYYQRISYTYNYQTILEYLEQKLAVLSHKFKQITTKIG